MPVGVLRFYEFELDLGCYELRRSGRPVKLEKIPLDLLILLVEKKGELATREEIIEKLWGKEVFLDTEQGINTAVRKIRLVLRDDPEQPRFLQTVVGRGYRFIAPLSNGGAPTDSLSPVAASSAEKSNPTTPIVDVAGPPVETSRLPLVSSAHLRVIEAVLAVAALTLTAYLVRQRFLETARQGKIMIAVLPFESFTSDPEQQFFSEGMTEEMITQLGRLNPEKLGVIGRNSAMRYKNAPGAVELVGKELRVDYILEGSARYEGGKIRIVARLIRLPDQRLLWTQTYDRDFRSVLPLQSEVAAAIADAINLELTAEQRGHLAQGHQVDPEAYNAYLKGRYYWNQRTESDLEKAEGYFRQAIDLDPADTAAYCGLADSYAALGYGNYLAPTDAFSKARTAATKALELEPDSAEAHASMGYISMYFDWDFVRSGEHFQRAIKLNPNYVMAHHWYSILLTALGRPEEARAEMERAQKLDPLSIPINTDMGFEFHYSGRNKEAIRQLEVALEMNPKFPLAHFWLGRVYGTQGLYEQAIAEFDAAGPSMREWQPVLAAKGYVYGKWGKRAEALSVLEQFNTLSKNRFVTSYGVALVYAGLGDNEQSLIWLRKAYDERSHWLVWLNLDPRFAGLRSDPRFAALRQKIGLAL